ncbi:MAG TPA: IPExxxVDY family protein [Bacteroidia bacterium]|jgi:hypothetical protein
MTRHKLDIEYDYDFHLIGISSHDKDYRFCWAINNKLGYDFQRGKNIVLKERKKTEADSFSVYEYQDEEMFTDFFIIVNRSGTALLVPEHRQADYLLLVRGNMSEDEKKDLIKNIKEIPNILTAFDIDPESLKSKQNLIF